MKSTTIVKISSITEILSPVLLQCRNGACGGCPNNTGKLLWIPRKSSTDSGTSDTFNFRYEFFDRSAEGTGVIKYNLATGFNTLTSSNFTYETPPTQAWAIANQALTTSPSLSPSLMKGTAYLTQTFTLQLTGGWLFFRQPNPAISNIHDALCFEYNHEKRLITFRSF